jgi:hypothetical protein
MAKCASTIAAMLPLCHALEAPSVQRVAAASRIESSIRLGTASTCF